MPAAPPAAGPSAGPALPAAVAGRGQPPAPRLRAPSWRDPRLVVGVLLVLASVLAGSWVVASADRTTPVWAAATTLAPGDRVTASSLRVVRVRLEGGAGGYLAAGAVPEGLVVLREVSAGDLVPRSAVGSAAALGRRPVGLPVRGPLPSGLVKGALVDVWVTPPPRTAGIAGAAAAGGGAGGGAGGAAGGAAGAAAGEPRRLAAAAPVAEVATDSSAFAAAAGATVQVLLADGELQDALAALASDAVVALVLVPGSTPAGA